MSVKHILVFFLCITFLSHFAAKAQYSIIPTGTSESLTEIVHKEGHIFINGNEGYLGKLVDEEVVAITSPSPFSYYQSDLYLIDTSHFYISSHKGFSHHGMIFESNDLGITWNPILDTTDMLFNHFVMFDTSHGCVVSTFYKTINTNDAGENWTILDDGLITSSAIQRINDSSAVMGITEKFRYTTDYGVNWSGSSFVQSVPRAYFAPKIDSLFVVSYGVTGNFFSYGLDLFETGFTHKSIPGFEPNDLHVRNLNEVYIIGRSHSTGNCSIMKTMDLGETWFFYDFGIEGTLLDIVVINDSCALISGTNGLLFKWSFASDFEFLHHLEPVSSDLTFSIYPNPTANTQTIDLVLDRSQNVKIELLSFSGHQIKLIHSGILGEGAANFVLNLGQLSDGIYYYSIQLENGQFIQEKFVKN